MRLVVDCPLSTDEESELRAWIAAHDGSIDEVSVRLHAVVLRASATKATQMAYRQRRTLVAALDQAYRDLF